MPGSARLGDKAEAKQDKHGCPACPHDVIGPTISGSANVLINGKPAARKDDAGVAAPCCGPNTWVCKQGSQNVIINGKDAMRNKDQTTHCGGDGKYTEGSDNVLVNGS